MNHQTLWHAPAFYNDTKTSFTDKDFHKYLDKAGIERRPNLGTEWFYFDGTPERSKQLFDSFRHDGMAGLQDQAGKTPYHLRPEQEAAVQQTLAYFQAHSDNDDTDEQPAFLWNAKPRFGKTLAAYDLAKRLDAKNILIVTNRPSIGNSWYDDFDDFISGYHFVSDTDSLKSKKYVITRKEYLTNYLGEPQIAFLSLQDLKGSEYFGGHLHKLEWIRHIAWDLLIIDECHEGVDTDRTNNALDRINRKLTLELSGTPFKALASGKFPADAIYNWTYLDEQKAKADELASGQDNGDHVNLPDLKLYTYRISEMTAADINDGIDIDGENHDYSFDLNGFFATNSRHKFIREADVKAFLHNLTTNEKYPFSTPELRNELKHTFWYVGNRVDSVKALAKLLSEDPVFKDYEVVIAAGDGRPMDDNNDYLADKKSIERVRKAIDTHDKTITLSCTQLITGVTIREWSAILMLTDISTTEPYIQAAFRVQNPYSWTEVINGESVVHRKKSAYIFDFSPVRVLRTYSDFASKLQATASSNTSTEQCDNIRKLLNFFPVISEDRHGKMVELDAGQVLTFPNTLAATEVVQARFMSNLLFNSSIKDVFNIPKQVEDTLNKMGVETNKRVINSKASLDLDHSRKLQANTEKRIDQNQDVILGEKIYGNNIDQAVDLFEQSTTTGPTEAIDKLTNEISRHTEPVIAKIKETYHLTNAETDELRQRTQQKQKQIVDEYVSKDIQDRNPEQLKQNLRDSIETDLVHHEVEKQEQQKVKTERKSKEEQVKEHLRAFTRTIPMCIMANHTGQTITIDNFDDVITDEDFEDLTNITKEEFAQLRDGFYYDDDNGDRCHFDGVFDKYCFNAAIAEFIEKKNQLDKYWLGDQHDIFEWIPNQKNNQIFTPKRVVVMMVDDLQKECPNLFDSTSSRFIDLYMKSGLYVTEIAKRLFKNTRHFYNSDDECIKHILENQVYGLAPTNILYNITLSTIFSDTDGLNIKTNNIKQYDLLADAKDGTARQAVMTLFNNSGDPMFKFDAVVGNPPYQEEIKGRGDQPPIYHYFIDAAYHLAPLACLVHPARFLFNAGATPKSWNEKMLNDPYLQVRLFEQNSSKIFPSTDIKGGITVTLRDVNNRTGGLGGFFIHYPELASSLKKVRSITTSYMDSIITPNTSYKYSSLIYEENPELRLRVSGGSVRYLASSVFDTFREIFFDDKPDDGKRYAKIYGRQNNERVTKFIREDYLLPPESYWKYKVLVPASNGSGAIGEVLSTPLIGTPLIGHTETFISIGSFDNKSEADNLLKYIKTKFARAMLGTLKITQSNKSKDVWRNIPSQDFTANSDIDWSKSIPEIDQQLYRKYGLTDEEIDFIETHVKPMD